MGRPGGQPAWSPCRDDKEGVELSADVGFNATASSDQPCAASRAFPSCSPTCTLRAQAPAPRSPARITGWGGRGFAAVLMFKMFFTSPLTCLVTVQDTSSAQPCPRNLVSCCLPPFLHWMRECSYFFPQRSVQGNRGECFRFRKTLQKKKKKYFLKILLVLLDWC